jgi:hypothetical protein
MQYLQCLKKTHDILKKVQKKYDTAQELNDQIETIENLIHENVSWKTSVLVLNRKQQVFILEYNCVTVSILRKQNHQIPNKQNTCSLKRKSWHKIEEHHQIRKNMFSIL